MLGAYVVLYPAARIVTMLFIGFMARLIEIPAWIYLIVWFLIQFVSGLASLGVPTDQGGIAWFAHIGGFVAGPLLLFLLGGCGACRRLSEDVTPRPARSASPLSRRPGCGGG